MRVLCLAALATVSLAAVAVGDIGEQAFLEVGNRIAESLNELNAESLRAVLDDEYFQESLEEEGKTADEWLAEMNQGAQQMLDMMGRVEAVELAELDPPDGAFLTLRHERGSSELLMVLDESHRITEINLRPIEHPEMEHPEGEEHPEGGESEKGDEHPEEGGEHPEKGAEHPEEGEEHPKEAEPPTVESVARFLESEVAAAADHDGWMEVRDAEAGADLRLKLDKIHRERLSKTAEATYFVCADFTTPEGKTYDLDFWVKESGDGLSVTETIVHKEEGTARYNWVEEGGIWKRKSR